METSQAQVEAIVRQMLAERDAKKHREETERHIQRNEVWMARLIGGLIGFTLGLGFAILVSAIGSRH
jgi:hypothetical protein